MSERSAKWPDDAADDASAGDEEEPSDKSEDDAPPPQPRDVAEEPDPFDLEVERMLNFDAELDRSRVKVRPLRG